MAILQLRFIGGIGNMLHQYAAARKHAETNGATLEVGPDMWVGAKIFGFNDPPWSRSDLQEVNDGCGGMGPSLEPGQVNVRVGGYFQTQRWVGTLSRAELKRWFVIQQKWLDAVPPLPLNYLAAHVRQADYIGHPCFCNVTEESYIKACEEHNLSIRDLIWVKQDTPRRVWLFENMEFPYLADFVTLMKARVILRANSSFSWWAAVLSDAEVYSPVVGDMNGWQTVPFVKGNHPRIAHPNRVGVQVDDLYLPE
jgi:hypothetical protein